MHLLAELTEAQATRFEWVLLIAGGVLTISLLSVLIFVFTRKDQRR